MSIEAQLHWNDGLLQSVDRLIVPESALAGDERWQAAVKTLSQENMVWLDAAPWIVPSGLASARFPLAAFHLRKLAIPGRFYPRLAFPSLAQGPRDLKPVRLLARDDGQLVVDPNHPLAGLDVRLNLRPSTLACAPRTRLTELFEGSGMQRPLANPLAAYLGLDALSREDEEHDELFYRQPRFTEHLDAVCRAHITQLYARLLLPVASVLDLMASWDSHLPEIPAPVHVAGLGLNGLELHANSRLTERVVKDLNQRPDLPWSDAQFDSVVCTASIEYLVYPLEVIGEVRRVLKPGGIFIVTFSDRWFPPKAIRVWSELHPFERAGLVASLLAKAGFEQLGSETLRGLKRPEDDKYSSQRSFSDPLFAVWGRTPRA